MSPRKASDLTVTDQFCGAGGSSLGARRMGLRVRMALNHWDLAIETHNTNFPETDHDCTDISACDPRRYPSTDILITSPECTTHSPAGGNKRRKKAQRDLFLPEVDDPSTARSRATMWDVVRFAEYHQYRAIIVENVVEVFRNWPLFPVWWQAMEALGYVGQPVSLNSMFALPTPQSRDRLYIVWTKKGNRRPDLDVRPRAHCLKCGDVEARQSWKTGRRVGKYGPRYQYVYVCSSCNQLVTPYYFCGLNVIDFSIPAERIGDRKVPLRERTLERIRYGLERFGNRDLVITANQTTGVACRVRDPLASPIFSQTTSNTTALVQPFLVVQRTHSKARSLHEPLATVCAGSVHHALVQPAAILRLMGDRAVSGLESPLAAQMANGPHDAIIGRSPFLIQYYGTGRASSSERAVPTVSTKDRCGIVTPAGKLRLEDCYFRMLKAHEIGAAMAFPEDYVVLGKQGERIRQYGNAVTPPAMEILLRRVVASLHPEIGAAA